MNPRLLLHLGSDFGLPPWGEAPGAGSFEVKRDSEDLSYPRGKHFALGIVGCKPPWAGGQRSSTMDYLVGIFLLLCGVALPGRVAPQHTKESVPRLKLSYKGKFFNQSPLPMHTSIFSFFNSHDLSYTYLHSQIRLFCHCIYLESFTVTLLFHFDSQSHSLACDFSLVFP